MKTWPCTVEGPRALGKIQDVLRRGGEVRLGAWEGAFLEEGRTRAKEAGKDQAGFGLLGGVGAHRVILGPGHSGEGLGEVSWGQGPEALNARPKPLGHFLQAIGSQEFFSRGQSWGGGSSQRPVVCVTVGAGGRRILRLPRLQ